MYVYLVVSHAFSGDTFPADKGGIGVDESRGVVYVRCDNDKRKHRKVSTSTHLFVYVI